MGTRFGAGGNHLSRATCPVKLHVLVLHGLDRVFLLRTSDIGKRLQYLGTNQRAQPSKSGPVCFCKADGAGICQ